jgi:hypothetical protein
MPRIATDGCQVVDVPGYAAGGHVRWSIKGGWTWHFADEDARSLPFSTRREAVATMFAVAEQRARLAESLPVDPGTPVPFTDLRPGQTVLMPNVARIASDGVFRVFEWRQAVIDRVRIEHATDDTEFAVVSVRTDRPYAEPWLMVGEWYAIGAIPVDREVV